MSVLLRWLIIWTKHINIITVWYVYDAWDMITWCLEIMKVWWTVCKWQVEYVLNCEIPCVLRCCIHWVVNYESYNNTTVGPFKGDELMHDEYYDVIYCGNPMSWITLRRGKLKLFWEQLRSRVFCMVHR